MNDMADELDTPFSDNTPDDDSDLFNDDASASPADKGERAKKRSERLASMLEEGRKSAERVKALEAEQGGLRSEIERLKGFVSGAAAARPQAPPGKDEFEIRLDAVYEQQKNAYEAMRAEVGAKTFTQARQDYYDSLARQLETEKGTILAERAVARRAPLEREQNARQIWEQKYPEVYSNPRAFQYAQATFYRRRALEPNVTVTPEMVDEIMEETRTQLKLGGKRAPSSSDRARLSGTSAGGPSGGGNSEAIPMPREFKAMAREVYSDLPEEQAYKKWAQTAGKELRKQKII